MSVNALETVCWKRAPELVFRLMDKKSLVADDQKRIEAFVSEKLPDKVRRKFRARSDSEYQEKHLLAGAEELLDEYFQKFFESHWEQINEVLDHVCRKANLDVHDTEDLKQTILHDLLNNRCLRLRRFKGDRITNSYLRRIMANLVTDYIRKEKSKRIYASKTAQTLGEKAVALELLMTKGESLNYAIEALQTAEKNRGEPVTSEKVWRRLAAEVKPKRRKTLVSIDSLHNLANQQTLNQEDQVFVEDLKDRKKQLMQILKNEISTLNEQERMAISMLYSENLSITEIAARLEVTTYSINRILKGVYEEIRQSLQKQGFNNEDVRSILEYGASVD